MYKPIVQEEYEDSCNTAILEEVGLYENLDGLDIITMHGMDGEKMLHKKKHQCRVNWGAITYSS